MNDFRLKKTCVKYGKRDLQRAPGLLETLVKTVTDPETEMGHFSNVMEKIYVKVWRRLQAGWADENNHVFSGNIFALTCLYSKGKRFLRQFHSWSYILHVSVVIYESWYCEMWIRQCFSSPLDWGELALNVFVCHQALGDLTGVLCAGDDIYLLF